MTDTKSPQIVNSTLLAPFIYFDAAPTYGVNAGAIEVELTAHVICPTEDGLSTERHPVMTAHLRCSPTAAANLRDALDKALGLLAVATAAPAPNPGGKFN